MAIVTIPTFPKFDSPAVTVNQGVIDLFAQTYCNGNPPPAVLPAAAAVDFFYSYLPLSSVDQVFQSNGSPTDPTLAELLGNLYVSGYFGGGWLAPIVFGGGDQPDVSEAAQSFLREIAGLAKGGYSKDVAADGNWLTLLEEFVESIIKGGLPSQNLVKFCADQITAANTASDSELLSTLPDQLMPMIFLCGYNLGFLIQMFDDNPGVNLDPINQGSCLLDFSSTGVDIATDLLGNWSDVIPDLLQPPVGPTQFRWERLQAAMNDIGGAGKYVGGLLWAWLLQNTKLKESSSYAEIFNLGVGYQLLAQTITLAMMSAWANQNAETGRLAVILEACFILWSGGYAIGLGSGNTDQPTIICLG